MTDPSQTIPSPIDILGTPQAEHRPEMPRQSAEWEKERNLLHQQNQDLLRHIADIEVRIPAPVVASLSCLRQELDRQRQAYASLQSEWTRLQADRDRLKGQLADRLVDASEPLPDSSGTPSRPPQDLKLFAKKQRQAEARIARLLQRIRFLEDEMEGGTRLLEAANTHIERLRNAHPAAPSDSGDGHNAIALEEAQNRVRELERQVSELHTNLDEARVRIEVSRQTTLATPAPRPAPVAALKSVWRVRDGIHIYGPVALSTLRTWAADCRVGPTHEVSQNEGPWQTAPRCAELGMDWVVTLVDGQSYGPIHILAVCHLIDQDALAPDTMVVHQSAGESLEIGWFRNPGMRELMRQNERLVRELSDSEHHLQPSTNSGMAETLAPPAIVRQRLVARLNAAPKT